jgi:amino acid transporter
MAAGKKFGTFGGVFTPSILTILGVIMYLRMGWIVGNFDTIWGLVAIILLAHVISVTTGLSISSIATDKKVGAGGVYYVLSRSLGLPIGGALGLTLFVATAFSISLYLVGFAEILNEFTHFGYQLNEAGEWVQKENVINSYRITASLALLVLTIVAFISTSIAIKSQYIILTVIVLSLGAIFMGDGLTLGKMATETQPVIEKVGFFALFAVFFPAVTGFTAGVAMSGDLKDPKKAIPIGTMGSIAVGLVIYMVLGVFLFYMVDGYNLVSNPKALFNLAAVGLLVYLGVWGATLSSALGGILGGPRILQAMSVDKITPKIFAKGVGKSNEPRNALILTVLIAEAGILIGELNLIAEVVSMFYLAAYGFINLSFFLESWASSDFNPTFRVKKWVGLLGFIATFTVMSQLNLLAMVAAFVIIGGIYFYLSRKQIALGTGDIWQSVWSTIVKKGLKRMESGSDHKRNWKPNTLLFSIDQNKRTKLIEFSKAVSGQGGIITNFDLHENPEAKVLFPKSKETVQDDELDKFGVFGRRLEVQNVFKGIESIACTFGFSGIEPNTVLMDWPGKTKDPIWFTEMTAKLFALDYNVLYLDYDERWGFRKKEKIDLWWRAVGNNAELMLSLAKFINGSPDWSQANIRILLVNDTNVDFKVVENRIMAVVEQFRVKAEVKVINNEVDQKPIYELMKIHSGEADLVFVGIPEINENDQKKFVEATNNLVGTIGTTLLVKASSNFDETDLKLEQISLSHDPVELKDEDILSLSPSKDEKLRAALSDLDEKLNHEVISLIKVGTHPIEQYHQGVFSKVTNKMNAFLTQEQKELDQEAVIGQLHQVLEDIRTIYQDALENELPVVHKKFDTAMTGFFENTESIITYQPKRLEVSVLNIGNGDLREKRRKIAYNDAVRRVWYSKGIQSYLSTFLEFGYDNLLLLHRSKNILHDLIWQLIDELNNGVPIETALSNGQDKISQLLHEAEKDARHLASNLYARLRTVGREHLNELSDLLLRKDYKKGLEESFPPMPGKLYKAARSGLVSFPSYWYRNLILFTYHLEADIYLIDYATAIQELNTEIAQYTQENYLSKIQSNITDVSNQLEKIKSYHEAENEEGILGAAVRVSEELFFNSEYLVNRLFKVTVNLEEDIPEEIELMTARSINSIREAQGSEIKTEKIALQEITSYLARTKFTDPIHERIQLFYGQLKRMTGRLLNITVKIQAGIDNYALNQKTNSLIEVLDQSAEEIQYLQADFEASCQSFKAELLDRQGILRQELDVNQIIEQVETLRQYVKEQKRRNVFVDGIRKINQKTSDRLGGLVNYLAQKKQDLTAEEYRVAHDYVVSEQGQLADFVDRLAPKADVPFFYEQLFTGSHYSDSKTIENRAAQIAAIEEAVKGIQAGRTGAIAVLGSAGSGKSFITTHVASHVLSGNVYKVLPPVQRKWNKNDIQSGIQRATGMKDILSKIFRKLPNGSIFIFENIEQWWLKAANGNAVANDLSAMINKYGQKHYFFVTGNIYSFGLMAQSSTIQNAIIKTVLLPPMDANQVRDAIWTRHQNSGLRIRLNGENEQHIQLNKLNKYLTKFHQSSKGNIGVALHQWVAAIERFEENELEMKDPQNFHLPKLENEHWKNLIYQLFIHYSLSRESLYKIYGESEKGWVNRILQSLRNAGIIEQNERGEFVIRKIVKPYIELWLNEIGFIK